MGALDLAFAKYFFNFLTPSIVNCLSVMPVVTIPVISAHDKLCVLSPSGVYLFR